MNNENLVVADSRCIVHAHRPVSWSAIFTGAFIGLGLGFLLQLYAVAIGLGVFASSANGAVAVAAGGILGLLVGVIASMLAAGYATGYLARSPGTKAHLGVVYGFTTWSVALSLSALMMMPISQYMSAYSKSLVPAGKEMAEKINTAKKMPKSSTQSANSANNEMAKSLTAVQMTWSAWIIFVMFFAGAFSACLGACWGLGCKFCHENSQ